MRTKGCDSLIGLTLEIEAPSLIGALNGSLSPLNRNIIFTLDRLAVEDKQGGGFVSLPAVKVVFDMCSDAG